MLAGLLWAAHALRGVERFPPPDFESGYTFPATTAPPPRADFMQYVDVAVLLGALSLAAYFVLKLRSRKHVFWLTVFSMVYFGFYRKGCVCSVGSTQDVALALFNAHYALPWAVLAFFLLPLIFALFFGRVFCAAVCPLGAIQELVVVKPKTLPPWLEHGLSVLPFLYLGAGILFAATGSAFLFCQYDPFVSLYRRSGAFSMLALGGAFLLLGTMVGRPYCRFLCPYGALLSLCSRFSRHNVTLLPEDCVHCQLCDVACPYGAIREPTGLLPAPTPQQLWRRRLAMGGLAVLLVAAGGWLGRQLAVPFSKMNATVALAEQVAAEATGRAAQMTDASKAFHDTGKPVEELYATAMKIRGRFAVGGMIWGAFAGLVLGLKLLSLAQFDQRRCAFEPDPGQCVACARCYTHCPNEQARIKREQRARTIPLSAAPAGASVNKNA
ncbi:MAG: 4Fe-4S binding protein [Verrucomicrobiae bacterium]|nr:4Fe-4S binding protein [Verrucomicrobiae bacterium]